MLGARQCLKNQLHGIFYLTAGWRFESSPVHQRSVNVDVAVRLPSAA
jgi:hypothetical protein